MIARNEEKYIENCLNSVKDLVGEFILVDTGSNDRTLDIAKNICKKFPLNAKFFDFTWSDDFSAARNESTKHATSDWILVLDADEKIDRKDIKKIDQLMKKSGEEIAGFSFEQRTYLDNYFEGAVKNDSELDQVKKYPFYISHFLVRLFRNNLGIKFTHRIHELVEDSLNEKNLKHEKTDVIIHHFGSVKDGGFIRAKSGKYSEIILRQLDDDPNRDRYNYQAARMYLGRRDIGNALKYFEKTAKINPRYKLVFSEIAKIHLLMNDSNRAIEYFKKSIKHNPDNPSPANNLAVVYMTLGKFEKAKEILEEQIKKHPDNKALKFNYDRVLENLKY